MVMLLLGGLYLHIIVEYSDLKGSTRIKLLNEWSVCKCCLMESVIIHHLRVLLGCQVVSCLASVEFQLQRLCISLGLPIVGLKPVLREIRSTAHFIFNGGSVGFPPVTLDESLIAFYLNLTIF